MSESGTGSLFGRSSELDRTTGLLEEVTNGAGRLALIEGEAGIGKTALLQELLRRASARGFQVFAAGAGELDRDLPFGAIARALELGQRSADPTRREIADLLSSEGHSGDTLPPFAEIPGIRFRVLEAVLALIEQSALSAPVALAIENLHWADQSTLLCLDHLARRLPYISLLLVGTARPPPHATELRRVLDQLVPSDGIHVLLRGLDEGPVADLVRQELGFPPGPSLLAAVEDAAGNPLYVKEFLAALNQEGAIEVSDGHAELRVRVFPPSLRLIILKQLDTLSSDALDTLRVASVLGTSFSVRELGIVLGEETSTLLAPLDESVQSGVLGEMGEDLTFRHELVREAIYSDLTVAMRNALHAQAAAALARSGAPARAVASHIVLAARPGDRSAAEWLARAAREAGPSAPGTAVELFQNAMDLLPSPDAERDHLMVDLSRALLFAGRAEEAETLARETLASVHDRSIDAALRFVLARSLNIEGRASEAAQEMAIAAEDPSASEAQKIRLFAEAVLSRAVAGILPGTSEMAHEAKRRAAESGDRVAECVALSGLCCSEFVQGRLEEGAAFGQQAVEAANDSPRLEGHHVLPSLYAGVALIECDHLKEGEQILQTGLRAAQQAAPSLIPFAYHQGLALGQFHAGDWDDAITEIEVVLSAQEEAGLRTGSVQARSALGFIALHRGDLPAANAHVAAAEQDFSVVGPQFLADWMWWVRALIHEALGESERALNVLNEAWEMCIAVGLISERRTLGPDLIRLMVLHDDVARASTVAKAVEDAASLTEVPSVRGAALRCRGLVGRDPDALLSSVAVYRGSPRLLERALAAEDAATVLLESGRSDEVARLLREAVEVYERLGAVRDLARADAALRHIGVRRGRRGSRGRPTIGWDSLTPTEWEVVRLAAEGLTNAEIGERLFISRRTVETHLSHVFGKVGVSSRVQLAAEAARRAS